MPVRDQGACGACWAFAATSVFSTRLCIQSGGAAKIDMSPQVSINCNTANNGCGGGTLGAAWEYFKNSGTVAETSLPFTGKKGTCSVSSSTKRYYAASYSRPTTVAAMQQAIYDTGAIQVGMDIYSDFYSYKSGVYSRTSNSLAGGHSVYLVGWGTDTATGKNFWIGVNSWGTAWGSSGTFKIQRGVNMVNIEKGYMPVAGVVAASSIPTVTTKAPTTTTKAPTTTTKAPTTRAPTTLAATKAALSTTAPVAPAPSGCWTCYPGYMHWFDLGLPEPADKCACVKVTTTTTRAPTTTTSTKAPTIKTSTTVAPVSRNCWTCPPNFVHWYDIGLPEPADKCACVVDPASRNCWTCPPNFVHWYDIGLPEPADKCACVPKP